MIKILAIFMVFQTSLAFGAFTNYNSVLIGEQAAGLGGAYTAMVGDSSAASFYNPGSIIEIEGESISASATLYNKFDTSYGAEDKDLLKAGERINRGFFRTIPSSIGSIFRYKKWAIALSIVVPDYDFFAGNLLDNESAQSFLNYTDESLWSGISISRRWNQRHSWGLTTYYTARSLTRSHTDRLVVSPTQELVSYEEKSINHNGIIFVFGYLFKISPHWSLGLSYRPPVLTISSEGTFYRSETDTSLLPSQISFAKNVNAQTYIPPKLSMGTSIDLTNRWKISADASYYWSHAYRDFSEGEGIEFIRHRATWNFALGSEFTFKDPRFSTRLGFFSNNPAIEEPSETPQSGQPDHLKMSGFSANVAFYTSKNVKYTVGGFYTGGKGFAVQKLGNSFLKIPKNHHIFTLLISTSYEF